MIAGRFAPKRVLSHAASSGFVKAVTVLAGGSAVSQAIPIFATPVLSRLYSPADMGLLGLYTSFISLATNAMTLGYSQAIVSGKNDDEGARLAGVSLAIVVPMSLIGSLTLYTMTSKDLLGYGSLSEWSVSLMMLSLILTGAFFSLRYWMIRVGRFRDVSMASVAQSGGRVATQLGAGLLTTGGGGLIVGEVVGRGAGLLRMWKASREALVSVWTSTSPREFADTARKYKKFPLLTAPSSLLNSLALVLPVPLITMFFSLSAAGQYAIASRVISVPLSLIGQSVGDVFHSRIAAISRNSPRRALPLLLQTAGGLFMLGLIPGIVLALWGEEIFSVALGPDWHTAGSIAAVIVPWTMMQFAVSPVSRLVQVYQGQEFKLVYDTLAIMSIVGVLTLGDSRGWSLATTMGVLGWSQAIVYAIYFLLLIRVVRKYLLINFQDGGVPTDAT